MSLLKALAPIAVMAGVGFATGRADAAFTAKSAAEGFLATQQKDAQNPFGMMSAPRARNLGQMDLTSRALTNAPPAMNPIQRIALSDPRMSRVLENLYANAAGQEIIDLYQKFAAVPITAEGGKKQPIGMTTVGT
jgi:hypothetical protein